MQGVGRECRAMRQFVLIALAVLATLFLILVWVALDPTFIVRGDTINLIDNPNFDTPVRGFSGWNVGGCATHVIPPEVIQMEITRIMKAPTSSCAVYHSAATCERYGSTLHPTECKHTMEHIYSYEYIGGPSPVELAEELGAKQAKSKQAMERQTKQARSKRFVPRF